MTKEIETTGSISNPSKDIAIDSVAKFVLRHITSQYDQGHEQETAFDLDNFLQKEYNVHIIPRFGTVGPTLFKQRVKKSQSTIPKLEYIKKFLTLIFTRLKLNTECSIIALIYVDRLSNTRDVPLTTRNWQTILIASILSASKIWDDLGTWNIEFADLFPHLGKKHINDLETTFLKALEYRLMVSGVDYAKYYYALRGARSRHDAQQAIPRLYVELGIGVPKFMHTMQKSVMKKIPINATQNKRKFKSNQNVYGDQPKSLPHLPVGMTARSMPGDLKNFRMRN